MMYDNKIYYKMLREIEIDHYVERNALETGTQHAVNKQLSKKAHVNKQSHMVERKHGFGAVKGR